MYLVDEFCNLPVHDSRLSTCRVPEYIVVLVTSNFRATLPAPRRYTGGQEPELLPGQGPKPPPQLAHTTASLLERGEEGRELSGG
jgi:hypothetical protein